MNKLSTERAIEALYTVRAYYASLTAGYPKGKDCKGIDDVTCSEIANSCLMAIKALEQTGWIPVSERLPEEGKSVIASTKHLIYPEARLIKEDGWEWACEAGADYWVSIVETVEAWMPLPEPYNRK